MMYNHLLLVLQVLYSDGTVTEFCQTSPLIPTPLAPLAADHSEIIKDADSLSQTKKSMIRPIERKVGPGWGLSKKKISFVKK